MRRAAGHDEHQRDGLGLRRREHRFRGRREGHLERPRSGRRSPRARSCPPGPDRRPQACAAHRSACRSRTSRWPNQDPRSRADRRHPARCGHGAGRSRGRRRGVPRPQAPAGRSAGRHRCRPASPAPCPQSPAAVRQPSPGSLTPFQPIDWETFVTLDAGGPGRDNGLRVCEPSRRCPGDARSGGSRRRRTIGPSVPGTPGRRRSYARVRVRAGSGLGVRRPTLLVGPRARLGRPGVTSARSL